MFLFPVKSGNCCRRPRGFVFYVTRRNASVYTVEDGIPTGKQIMY